MGKSSSSAGAVIASVFITLVIVGAGGYFGLPYLYPILASEDIVEGEETILLQRINIESKTPATIDNTLKNPKK